MKSRNYCFTAFNDGEFDSLVNYNHRKYIIGGVETCPSTNTQHIQGYIELDNAYTIKSLKKVARTTHFEERKGTQQQAIEYCMKDNNFQEFGTKAEQGKRTDLDSLKESLMRGDSLSNISISHFNQFIKYHKGIQLFKQLNNKQVRDWPCELHIHWGIPGSGKSKFVHENNKGAYWLARPTNGSLYYYNYQGEEVIIIDDFKGWIPFTELLTLCDRYPKKVNTCGGYSEMLCRKVFITSNHPWMEWYNNDNDLGALERRITSITYYDKKYDPSNDRNDNILDTSVVFEQGSSEPQVFSALRPQNSTEVAGVILDPAFDFPEFIPQKKITILK